MNGRKSIAYGLVLVAAAALLQGCGSGAGINELDARMTEIKARPRGRIEPPPEFKPIATNQLGDEVYASPVVSGNRLYLRVAFKDSERREFLYAIGGK